MSKILENLRYTETHEWVEILNETTVRIGLSDFAQQALGDIVFINLPETGDDTTAGQALGDVESVKAVSEIMSPVTGAITAVNQAVIDQPELVNEDPYASWFVEINDISDRSELMSASEYEEFCKKESH